MTMTTTAQEEFNELMRNKDRRSRHPDDDDDARSFLNLSDDDDATPTATIAPAGSIASKASVSSSRSTIPVTRYGANTGPKGVISDAQNFRDQKRKHKSTRSTSTISSQSEPGVTFGEQLRAEKIAEADEEDLDDIDDLDGDFMDRWRKTRLTELQNGGYSSSVHKSGRGGRRLYGGLATVDGQGYLEAVEGSPADTVVVVYIYDDISRVSQAIEDCLKTLAGKHLNTLFVRLSCQEAEMEPAGVPAVIAYRGGNKFAALVPMIEEMPEDADLSAITLESVFRRHQILR